MSIVTRIEDIRPSDIKYFWKSDRPLTSYRKVAGIYRITCVAKDSSMYGEFYVGQGYDLYERLRGHFKDLRLQNHNNIILTRLFNKYLLEAFEFSIIKKLGPEIRLENDRLQLEPVLTKMEQCYLTAFSCEMNIAKVANSPLGITRSDETKEKLRQMRLGTKMSDEARQNMSDAGGEPFSLYHEEHGTVSGVNLFLYSRANGYCVGALYKVANGNSYTHKGWYQSESAYLDKEQWLKDNPIPKSKYPCVNWDRYAGCWKAALWFNDTTLNLGYFKDELDAHLKIVSFCNENGLKNKQRPFELYNPKIGWVRGEDLYEFGRTLGVKGSIFEKVLDERAYSLKGYYKSEEYFLDKQKWLDNNPLPISCYEGVCWSRAHGKWAVKGIRVKNKLHRNYKCFDLEEEAFEAWKSLKASIRVDSDLQAA